MKYSTRMTKVVVVQQGKPIFHESATFIEIEDDAAGEYIKLIQERDQERQTLAFDREEWSAVRESIDAMFAEIVRNDEVSKAIKQ
jgi:hypothetical protein